MTITNGYCTLDQFKDWSGAPSDHEDPERELAITSASRAVDEWCGTHFYQETATARVFSAQASNSLRPGGRNPIVSVTSIDTDTNSDGTFDTAWTSSDWQLLPVNAKSGFPYDEIRTIGTLRFPLDGRTGRVGHVQVTGTWGWPAVPASVTEATMILTNRRLQRSESASGVVSVTPDLALRVSSIEDPDVVQLLRPYKRSWGIA